MSSLCELNGTPSAMLNHIKNMSASVFQQFQKGKHHDLPVSPPTLNMAF